MTIELKPEQARTIDQAIQPGLTKSADEVVEAGLAALRDRLKVSARTVNPEKWMRKYRAWAQRHPTTLTSLRQRLAKSDGRFIKHATVGYYWRRAT